MTAHWGIADPAATQGTDAEKRHAFVRAFTEVCTRINLFMSLPIDKIDRLTLQRKLVDIGRIGRESPVS